MKRRLMGVFLLAFATWPAIQYGLTRRYGVDPWKLYGWAMYCVPGPMKTVRVFEIEGDGSHRLLPPGSQGPRERRALDRFRERRRALGRLASSEPAVRTLLALHPGAEGVVVAVLSLELDPGSARLQPRTETLVSWRDGSDEPFEIPEAALRRAFAAAPWPTPGRAGGPAPPDRSPRTR